MPLQRRCTCTTSTPPDGSRATRRLQAAVDALLPCYAPGTCHLSVPPAVRHATVDRLDASRGSRSQACRGRLSTRTTKTVNSAQGQELSISMCHGGTVAFAGVCPARAAQVPVPARRSLFASAASPASLRLLARLGAFLALSFWLLLQPSPHSPSAFPRLTQPCTL